MPVDATPSTNRRRTKQTVEDEAALEQRRARGEISCAECRRLKLRCDKKVPCASCVRRGCSSICPNGTLSTGQGGRFMLADTQHLHRKISEMAQRIRQLEDALAIFQTSVSSEIHPLLQEELLSIKYGPEIQATSPQGDGSQGLADTLGTLTIGEHGEAKYFGRSAGSESILAAGADPPDFNCACAEDSLSPDIMRLSNSFPFGFPAATEEALNLMYEYLPPQPRAWSLCEIYYEHVTFVFNPIKRDQLIDEILSPVYKFLKSRENNSPELMHPVSPHQLAVLFVVFALGTLTDLTLPPLHRDAKTYFQLCKAALSCRPVINSPEISTIQAITLMAMFHGFSGSSYTLDGAWVLISLATKLGQSIGLHRDSARWQLAPKIVNRRRALFWELFTLDLFMSLALGRPPCNQLLYTDCEFPADEDQTFDETGSPQVGFCHWKYQFAKNTFARIIEVTLAAQSPSYETILELDRQIRETSLPWHFSTVLLDDEVASPAQFMRRYLSVQKRAIILTYIHRSFFARALLDHPANPLSSPFAPSFLCAHQSASVVVRNTVRLISRNANLAMRWSMLWMHLFTAALILGSIVTRAPGCTMAPSAFIEFGISVDMFEKGAQVSPRARTCLGILNKLRAKTVHIYTQFRSGNPQPKVEPSMLQSNLNGEDELAIFGGHTRLLVSALLSKRSHHEHPKRSPSYPSSSPELPSSDSSQAPSHASSPGVPDSLPEVHPSVMAFISALPAHAPPAEKTSAVPFMSSDIQSSDQIFDDAYVRHAQEALQRQSLFADMSPSSSSESTTSMDQSPTFEFPVSGFSVPQAGVQDANLWTGVLGASGIEYADLNMVPSVIDEQWMAFMSGLFNSNSVNA